MADGYAAPGSLDQIATRATEPGVVEQLARDDVARKRFLKMVGRIAATVENLGAAAYLGQAPAIKSKDVLAAALSIHSIEARHAATLNTLLKQAPTPDGAFAKPMSMAQVLAAVKPFIA